MPQGSGAAGALWRFRHVGGADEVRAARVERYFLCIGRMSKPVQMSALLIARDGCECSCLRIERMNSSPAAAGGEPAKTSLVVIVDAR